MPGTNNSNFRLTILRVDLCIGLLKSLSKNIKSGSRGLLYEKIAILTMSKGINNQIYRIIKSHHETGHIRIGYRNRFALFHLFYPEGNHRTTAGHHIAVTGTANGSLRILSEFTPLGNGYLFHQCLGNTHGVDGVCCFISRKNNNVLHSILYGRKENIIGTYNISHGSFHRKKFTGRYLLKGSG